MINNSIDRQEPLFPAWAVGALGAGGSLGLVFGPAQGVSVTVLLACAVLALAVILGLVWQSHVRATRQWSATLEAYADREIARARSGKAVKRDKSLPPVRVASPSSGALKRPLPTPKSG